MNTGKEAQTFKAAELKEFQDRLRQRVREVEAKAKPPEDLIVEFKARVLNVFADNSPIYQPRDPVPVYGREVINDIVGQGTTLDLILEDNPTPIKRLEFKGQFPVIGGDTIVAGVYIGTPKQIMDLDCPDSELDDPQQGPFRTLYVPRKLKSKEPAHYLQLLNGQGQVIRTEYSADWPTILNQQTTKQRIEQK